jgi:hypothetical protein
MTRDTAEVDNGARREAASGSGPASDRVEVYLAPARGAYLPGVLGRLAHGFGLDVFGGSQLGRQAALALRFSALLLLVIVCFDLVAWTLLFNSIFHSSGDILDHDGWTAVAATFGVLIAAAIFIYERQFFTADTSDLLASPARFLAVTAAVAIRITILVAAALITAQPVELLVFREPLRQRTHEEAVREEVVTRVKQLAKLQEKLAALALQPAQLDAKMQGTKEDKELGLAKQRLQRATDTLASLRRQQVRAQNALTRLPQDSVSAAPLIAALERTIRSLNGPIARQASEVVAAERDVTLANTNFENRRRDISIGEVAQGNSFDQQKEMVHGYIDEVKKFGMKKPATLELPRLDPKLAPVKFSYSFRGSHFFDQLRILEDRMEGRQARWPDGVAEDERAQLSHDYALGHLAPQQEEAVVDGARQCSLLPWSSQPPAGAGPEVEQRISEACLFRRSYAVAYAIGMVIPLLVFAVKFLMPRELKHYFSVRQQAWAGHPEALACQRGEEKRRQAKEQARARRREEREEARARRRRSLVRRREPANA